MRQAIVPDRNRAGTILACPQAVAKSRMPSCGKTPMEVFAARSAATGALPLVWVRIRKLVQ